MTQRDDATDPDEPSAEVVVPDAVDGGGGPGDLPLGDLLGGGGLDLGSMMEMAQNMQQQMADAQQQLAGTEVVAFEPRNELVELLRRMGDHAGELKAGRELLDELLEAGEIDHAVELLQRLVASNPRNADLVIQLAEVCAALGDDRQAQRFYRHGVCLLQLEGRVDEANKMLDLIDGLVNDHEAIAMARDLLAKGQALEWEAIRWSLEQGQRRRIADEITSSTGSHPAVTGVVSK